jgi:hypothetical protein
MRTLCVVGFMAWVLWAAERGAWEPVGGDDSAAGCYAMLERAIEGARADAARDKYTDFARLGNSFIERRRVDDQGNPASARRIEYRCLPSPIQP